MAKNETARQVIKKYINTSNPGYALLIDAPWGAGKTHLIQEIMQELANEAAGTKFMGSHKDPYLYASLFGTNGNRTVDEAVISQTNWNLLEKGLKAISSIKLGEVGLTLGHPTLTNWLMPRLPNIIVLDDLERSKLAPEILYGQLNQYIEHGQKNVILLENTSKSTTPDEVKEWREKLIGRVVSIQADIDAALPAFLDNLTKEKSNSPQKFLEDMQGQIKVLFEETEYENLRLLKRTIEDVYELLGMLDDGFWEYPEKVSELVLSFAALSIAHHHGELTDGELLKRGTYESFPDKSDAKLRSIAERHPDIQLEILGHRNPVLPLKLSNALIGDGHMAKDALNAALDDTDHFRPPAETPLWRQVWDWRELPPQEAEKLVQKIKQGVLNLDITHPGELLHTYSGFYHMAKGRVIYEDIDAINQLFISVIQRIKLNGKLLPPDYKKYTHSPYGYEWRHNSISYGGYVFDLEPEMRPVIDEMKAAQDEVFQDTLPALAANLLVNLHSEPKSFRANYIGEEYAWLYPAYSIFAQTSPREFAKAFLKIIEYERDTAEEIAKNLFGRVQGYRSDLQSDFEWLRVMARDMVELSKQKSIMSAAQTRHFTSRFLSYDAENMVLSRL